jgi:hypothetical protein
MRPVVFGCVLLVGAVTVPVMAAESQKLDTAHVVVEGKVRTFFHNEPAADSPVITELIEVLVEKVEKAPANDGTATGKVAHLRTYRIRDVPGKIPPVGMLPYVRPAAGDNVKVYCYREEDGTYRILMNPEAIKIVAPKKE